MTKFIRNVFLFSLPVLLLAIAVEYITRQIPNNYSYKNNYLLKNASAIEVLILGSSHGFFDINPAYLDQVAFNASHVSQTLNYDYCIFQKYKNKLENLKVLVLPISYFTLFSRLEDGTEDWRVKNYSIYYGCKNQPSLRYNTEVFSTKPLSLLRGVGKHFWSNGASTKITVSDLGFGLKYTNVDQSDLVATGQTAAKRHTKKTWERLEENIETLNKIISESSSVNVNVFLFTPPALNTYIENLNELQLSEMTQSIAGVINQHSNVVYHSFLQDDRFEGSDFKDADHLNGVGAEKMTKIIDQELKNMISAQIQ